MSPEVERYAMYDSIAINKAD